MILLGENDFMERQDSGLVSIIIPTYKRANYLERAIESVIRQSYRNIEIIVVDDNDSGSKYREENIKIMSKYEGCKNIKYLKHRKNKNGAAARNTGIAAAAGEYLTFLDDDDFFLGDRIEKMVQALEKNKGYECAYSGVVYLKKTKIVAVKKAEREGNLTREVLSQDSFFGTGSNLFFRSSAVKKVGYFDEEFIRHQDIEYMVRYFKCGKVINVDEALVVKCMDDTSNLPNFDKMLDVEKMFLDKFQDEIQVFPEDETRDILFCNYYDAMLVAKYGSQEYENMKKRLLGMNNISEKAKNRVYIYDLKHRNKFMRAVAKTIGRLKTFFAVLRLGTGRRQEIKAFVINERR